MPKAWYYETSFQAGGINRIRTFSDPHSIKIDKTTNLNMTQDRSDYYYFDLHRNAKNPHEDKLVAIDFL